MSTRSFWPTSDDPCPRLTRSYDPRMPSGVALMDSLSDEVVQRLRTNDIVATVEEHFGPVRVQALPELNIGDNDCSVDGYYETQYLRAPDDPLRPP
jgi:hypothetical protein